MEEIMKALLQSGSIGLISAILLWLLVQERKERNKEIKEIQDMLQKDIDSVTTILASVNMIMNQQNVIIGEQRKQIENITNELLRKVG